MRDLVLTAILTPWMLRILVQPWVGLLMLAWLGYMNPNRYCYSFAHSDVPWVAIGAILTICSFLLSSEPKRLPITRETVLLLVFIAWTNITLQFALNPEGAWREWDRFMKIQIIIFLNFMLLTNAFRIRAMVWTIVVSLGIFGVKGGIWAIMSGGHYRVEGPEFTFIEDNNCLAVALNMMLPLMRFLQLSDTRKWVRMTLGVAMGLTILSIICSYSRAGFLALSAVMVLMWLKSRKKFVLGLVLAGSFYFAVNFMPAEWTDRMHTIDDYQQDNSAMGRMNAWSFALNLVKDHPVTGGGFRTFTKELFYVYAPNPEDHHEAHSIYFEVLAEQGWVGLVMFVLLGFFAWRSATLVRRRARELPSTAWAADLMSMAQVSLFAFGMGGAFVSLAYFDLPYHLIALVVATKMVVVKQAQEVENAVGSTAPAEEHTITTLTPEPVEA